jgi:hypothetical protein
MKDWTFVLQKLNAGRDCTQTKFTKTNTPKSLFDFWVAYRAKNAN